MFVAKFGSGGQIGQRKAAPAEVVIAPYPPPLASGHGVDGVKRRGRSVFRGRIGWINWRAVLNSLFRRWKGSGMS